MGTLAGMLGSMAVARWMAPFTPGAGPLAVRVWLAAPLVPFVAVASASVAPAGRALRVDPLTIMRDR